MPPVTFYSIRIEETGEVFRCSSEESILNGMERLGKKGIPVGCRGGGCGVCIVQITNGSFSKRAMSRQYVSEEDEANATILACRVKPTSDIKLKVIGRMSKSVCRTVAVEKTSK